MSNPEESERINKIIKKNVELGSIWVYLKELISLIKRNQLPELKPFLLNELVSNLFTVKLKVLKIDRAIRDLKLFSVGEPLILAASVYLSCPNIDEKTSTSLIKEIFKSPEVLQKLLFEPISINNLLEKINLKKLYRDGYFLPFKRLGKLLEERRTKEVCAECDNFVYKQTYPRGKVVFICKKCFGKTEIIISRSQDQDRKKVIKEEVQVKLAIIETTKIRKRNEFNSNGLVQTDLDSIRNDLIKNSKGFIQDLIKSLISKKKQPFTPYKIDLSLYYLKNAYEKAFPHKKHGGVRFPKAKNSDLLAKNLSLKQLTATVTRDKNISILEQSIVLNLLEGIEIRKDVPSFVNLISMLSELSRTVIQNRIRAGNYIIDRGENNKLILLYRNKEISHTRFLKERFESNNNLNNL